MTIILNNFVAYERQSLTIWNPIRSIIQVESIYWQLTFSPFVKTRKHDPFMLCCNNAKKQVGLLARIVNKVSILTILQYKNFVNLKTLWKS